MGLFDRKLDSVQVEVSTHCQLSCPMCPKSVFKKDWIHKHMDLETFKKIPFERFKYAHLQGWGEPLLNPNIIEMIEIAKRDGCSVGITTNGLLLDEFARDLVGDVDLVAISIAGAGEDVHRRIRKCRLSDLLENVRLLSELRKDKKPKITLVTMMLRETIHDLPKLVELAKDVNADEVIANNLDYVPSKDLIDEIVFSESENPEFSEVISEAKVLADELGITFVAKPIRLEEALVCAENPIKSCLITVNGDVCPCVYLHLPTKSDKIVRFFRGKRIEVRKTYFGNLRNENFKEIWNKEEYWKFRRTFEMRLLPDFTVIPRIPDLPEMCRSCYKAYSV